MKVITATIRLHIPAGQALPKPPLASMVAQKGVNIGLFCKDFNAKTSGITLGTPLPTVITVFADKSYSFITKSPTMTFLIKQAANITSGVAHKRLGFVGKITKSQVTQIASVKSSDSNAYNQFGMERMVEGSAKSMGIEVVEG